MLTMRARRHSEELPLVSLLGVQPVAAAGSGAARAAGALVGAGLP